LHQPLLSETTQELKAPFLPVVCGHPFSLEGCPFFLALTMANPAYFDICKIIGKILYKAMLVGYYLLFSFPWNSPDGENTGEIP